MPWDEKEAEALTWALDFLMQAKTPPDRGLRAINELEKTMPVKRPLGETLYLSPGTLIKEVKLVTEDTDAEVTPWWQMLVLVEAEAKWEPFFCFEDVLSYLRPR